MRTRGTVLTAVTLAALALSGTLGAGEEGLVAYWPMDDAEGDTLPDLSGNDNHGKVHGAQWEKAKYGKGLRFDGEDDYVDVGRDESLDVTKGLTVSVWVYPEKGAEEHTQILCKDYITRKLGYALWNTGWPDRDFRFWVADGSEIRYATAHHIEDEWVHLVGTFDGRFAKLYVDAELKDTEDFGEQTSIAPLTSDGIIGARQSATMQSHFRGIMDEFRIYDRALSAPEVRKLYLAKEDDVVARAREMEEALAKRPKVAALDASQIKSFSDPHLLSSLISLRQPITCEGITFKFLRRAKDEDSPLADIQDEERRRGYVVFQRKNPGDTYPDSVPRRDEIVADKIAAFTTPGEYEPVWFSIYPLRELEGIGVELTGDLVGRGGERIPRENVDVRRVTSWVQRKEKGSKRYWIIPELLERMAPWGVPANFTQSFWITIKVPEDAPSGQYEGTIAILADGSPATELSLDLDVLPFKLEKPEGVDWFVAACDIDWGNRLGPDAVERAVVDMAEHGCAPLLHTLYGGQGSPHIVIEDGKLAEFDCQRIRDFQKLRRKLAMKGPLFVNLNSKIDDTLCKQLGLPPLPTDTWEPSSLPAKVLENPTYRSCFKEVLLALDTLIKETGNNEEGYAEWYYGCFGEADSHAWRRPLAIWVAKLCKEAGIQTSTALVFGSRTDFFDELAPYLDGAESWSSETREENTGDRKAFAKHGIVFYDHRDVMATGQQVNLEGGLATLRYFNGFLTYKNGSAGFRTFLWHYPRGNQYNDLDCNKAREAKEGCLVHYADDYRQIIPTLQWEGVREGIKDYKYVHTLCVLIEEAKKSENARGRAAAIEKELAQLVEDVPWAKAYRKNPSSFDNGRAAEFRQRIAARIVELRDILGP